MQTLYIKDGRVYAAKLPNVGDTVTVLPNLGKCVVKSLTHDSYDNYIELMLCDDVGGHARKPQSTFWSFTLLDEKKA